MHTPITTKATTFAIINEQDSHIDNNTNSEKKILPTTENTIEFSRSEVKIHARKVRLANSYFNLALKPYEDSAKVSRYSYTNKPYLLGFSHHKAIENELIDKIRAECILRINTKINNQPRYTYYQPFIEMECYTDYAEEFLQMLTNIIKPFNVNFYSLDFNDD